MSKLEPFVRHHKRQTDCAIHQAYQRLENYPAAATVFHDLLSIVRNRGANLLAAPVWNGCHPGVEALVNLARFHADHIRPVGDWLGTSASWRVTVASLAHHLVSTYRVPMFLSAAWYETESGDTDKMRRWFVTHSRGVSFRSLHLPIAMTRKMEHIFLASYDHLPISHAMRRAELLALDTPQEFVNAILTSRLASDLSNGPFWRTFWHFLIANASTIEASQIGPMIDFIQAIRHNRVDVDTPSGSVTLDPPEPEFSIKGRTMPSLLKLMENWHRKLGLGTHDLSWTPSALTPMRVEEPHPDNDDTPPKVWQLLELTNSTQLRAEGSGLQHCVASYADRCWRGMSRIWSLRVLQGETLSHVLTIEVDPRRRTIVQVRGWRNRLPSGKPLTILRDWAVRQRLQLTH